MLFLPSLVFNRSSPIAYSFSLPTLSQSTNLCISQPLSLTHAHTYPSSSPVLTPTTFRLDREVDDTWQSSNVYRFLETPMEPRGGAWESWPGDSSPDGEEGYVLRSLGILYLYIAVVQWH